MSLLSDSQKAQVQQRLEGMVHPVQLLLFGQSLDCEGCEQARLVLQELPPLNTLISLNEHNLVLDREAAATYRVTRAPTIAIVGQHDAGVRLVGAPLGHEFSSLLDAVLTVSRGDSGLSPNSRTRLATLTQPVEIQVFSTPT